MLDLLHAPTGSFLHSLVSTLSRIENTAYPNLDPNPDPNPNPSPNLNPNPNPSPNPNPDSNPNPNPNPSLQDREHLAHRRVGELRRRGGRRPAHGLRRERAALRDAAQAQAHLRG